MPIDSSIYFNQQPLDVAGSVQKGFALSDAIYQRAKQRKADETEQRVKDAYSKLKVGPSGQLMIDPSAVQDLASQGLGQEAMGMQTTMQNSAKAQQEAMAKKQQEDAAYTFQLLDPSKYQGKPPEQQQMQWQADKQQAIKDGHREAAQLPDHYDPNLHQQALAHAQRLALSPDQFSNLQEKQQTHADMQKERDLRRQELGAQRDSATSAKSADAYQKASHDLNTFRGNAAVQQASSAMINVANALSLAEQGHLTPPDLHLFASELGKLATNGVPGHSEIAALVPDTAKKDLAKFISFWSNSPTDAQAQDFIDHNKTYLKELAKNYGKAIDTYKDNTLNGYKRKLSSEDYADLKQRVDSQSYGKLYAEPVHPVDKMSDDEVKAAYNAKFGTK